MRYAPRTIAFLAELLHPPRTAEPKPIQRLHNEMFEGGDPLYSSFHVTHQGAVLSNASTRPGAVSSVAFLPDRIQFREELTGLTVEDFAERVTQVAGRVAKLCEVQLFIQHLVTVRTLVNPRGFADSRLFMRDGIFGLSDEMDEFGRPASLFGMRLVFPPLAEQANAFTLKIESFHGDPRSMFLENVGSFGPQVPARGLETLGQNVQSTYQFLVERGLSFLGRFDQRPPEKPPERSPEVPTAEPPAGPPE